MTAKPLQFHRVRVVAVSVLDSDRANKFYAETLGLPPAYEEKEQVGYLVGETILMLSGLGPAPGAKSKSAYHGRN